MNEENKNNDQGHNSDQPGKKKKNSGGEDFPLQEYRLVPVEEWDGREESEKVKEIFPEGDFKVVHITCDPKTAQERDPKGLYAKAEKGEISGLTGFDADHEAPENPALTINTDELTIDEAVEKVLDLIEAKS